MTVLEDVMVN